MPTNTIPPLDYLQAGKQVAALGFVDDALAYLRQGLALEPGLQHAHHFLLWDVWDRHVRGRCDAPAERDETFDAIGVTDGALPVELTLDLKAALDAARVIQAHHDDYVRGYFIQENYRSIQDQVNRNHQFLELGPRQRPVVDRVLRHLEAPIRACLGTPWKVVNLKAWRTPAGAETFGMNAWHRDGFPSMVLKVLVYVTGASAEAGTTEIVLADGNHATIEGPPGTWGLFRNSDLTHRGIAPTTGERTLFEVTFAPALEMDLTPFVAGTNSGYPMVPWGTYRMEDNVLSARSQFA